MLDDPRNDIFIHMDSKNDSYDKEEVLNFVKNTNVYHTKRTSVTWGGFSQINSEMLLLKKAVSTGYYHHYHLLSGADLPIQTQDSIIKFFEENEGKEFVRFEKEEFVYQDRIRYFYPLQEVSGRGRSRYWRVINKCCLCVQRILKINRNKEIEFQKGTNWFSITDSLARYVVDKEEWIESVFKNTFCCDEVFLQTLIHNSVFKNNLFHSEYDNDVQAIMRLIDWKRGHPYIFRRSDYKELVESGMMFARKFDPGTDDEIIRMISETYSKS